MDDDEFEPYETFEDSEGEDEAYSEEIVDQAEDTSSYAGIHRAMLLLIIVLVIGIMMLGLFIAMRPAPVVVPTMRPPWLV